MSNEQTPQPQYARFETEHRVRPDDIDMFQHVHNSRYFDYVLAARYEQMEKFYGMSMEKFMERGFGWVVSKVQFEYKRPLALGDHFVVQTGIVSINEKGCRVTFTITNKQTGKTSCEGWFEYVMIDLRTGRSQKIPPDVIALYAV
jgi:acyl-CoA thioester hydrolase/thioesterase-3